MHFTNHQLILMHNWFINQTYHENWLIRKNLGLDLLIVTINFEYVLATND